MARDGAIPPASLLNMVDPLAFQFDHEMAHRYWQQEQGPTGLQAPYFVMPEPYNDDWKLRHQYAHLDALSPAPPPTPLGKFGPPIPQNLTDVNLADPNQRDWWIFANHMEHWVQP